MKSKELLAIINAYLDKKVMLGLKRKSNDDIKRMADMLTSDELKPADVRKFFKILSHANPTGKSSRNCIKAIKAEFINTLLCEHKKSDNFTDEISKVLFKEEKESQAKHALDNILRFNEILSQISITDADDINKSQQHRFGESTRTVIIRYAIDTFRKQVASSPDIANEATDILISALRKLYDDNKNEEKTYSHLQQHIHNTIKLIQYLHNNHITIPLRLKASICENLEFAAYGIDEKKQDHATLQEQSESTLNRLSAIYNIPLSQDTSIAHAEVKSTLVDDAISLLADARMDTSENKQLLAYANSENIYKAIKQLLEKDLLTQDNFVLLCYNFANSLIMARGIITLHDHALDTCYFKQSLCQEPQFANEIARIFVKLSHLGNSLPKETRDHLCANPLYLDTLNSGLDALKMNQINIDSTALNKMIFNIKEADQIANSLIIWIRNRYESVDRNDNWKWQIYFPMLKPGEHKYYELDNNRSLIPYSYHGMPAVNCLPFVEEVAKSLAYFSTGRSQEIECQVYYTIALLAFLKNQAPELNTPEIANKCRILIADEFRNSYQLPDRSFASLAWGGNRSSRNELPFCKLALTLLGPLNLLNREMVEYIWTLKGRDLTNFYENLLKSLRESKTDDNGILKTDPKIGSAFATILVFIYKNKVNYAIHDHFEALAASDTIVAVMEQLKKLDCLIPGRIEPIFSYMNQDRNQYFDSFRFILKNYDSAELLYNVLKIFIDNPPELKNALATPLPVAEDSTRENSLSSKSSNYTSDLDSDDEDYEEKVATSKPIPWKTDESKDHAILKEFATFLPRGSTRKLYEAYKLYEPERLAQLKKNVSATLPRIMSSTSLPEDISKLTTEYIYGPKLFDKRGKPSEKTNIGSPVFNEPSHSKKLE